jgi:hypothetical protein
MTLRSQGRIFWIDGLGIRKALGFAQRNKVLRGGNRLPLREQKTVGDNAQCGVMMEASPSSFLEVSEADFLLQFLIIPFAAPSEFGDIDHARECNV